MRANQAIEVMHKYGKSFYWASFFLGKKHTYNAAVLYEFCRVLDDLADGNEKNKAKLLIRNSETRGGGEIKIEWSNKDLKNI